MKLLQALRLDKPPRLAFVGAGGKTTAMFELARQLLENGAQDGIQTVIVTTTTHLSVEQVHLADQHVQLRESFTPGQILAALVPGVVLLTGEGVESGRVKGPGEGVLQSLRTLADEIPLPILIEADGAHQKAVKAPAQHEPPIPTWVDTVVVVCGMSGLGKPLSEEFVHRAQQFGRITGLQSGEKVSLEHLASEMVHPQGGLKNIPPGARRVALLNQADSNELQSQAAHLAEQILERFETVIIASLNPPQDCQPDLTAQVKRIVEPGAGIILAAGASTRFGVPKQLLEWRGEALLRWPMRAALEAGLDPVVLVLGYQAEEIRKVVADLPVHVVVNTNWAAGQSTSIVAGLKCLPAQSGSAVFFLADQPQVQATLVRSLKSRHAETMAPIVAPLVDGQRGNPVLFDRRTFPDLLALQGDVGGRALFARYPVTWLTWHDPAPLLDIDLPEDYQRLLDESA